jgi:hypothetical protein
MRTDLFPNSLPLLAKHHSMTVRMRDGGNGHCARQVQVTDGNSLGFVPVVSYNAFC